MNTYFWGIIGVVTLLVGCQDAGRNNNQISTSLTIEEANVLLNHEGWSEDEIRNTRLSAADVLRYRVKESDNTKAHILLNSMWHVHAVLRGRDVTFGEDIKGAWFKFEDDNTYKVGSFDKVIGEGRYHYDSDKSILIILNDDPRMKPQEFNVLSNNNAIVFVGEATYKDNNMQCKLHREEGFPVKPSN